MTQHTYRHKTANQYSSRAVLSTMASGLSEITTPDLPGCILYYGDNHDGYPRMTVVDPSGCLAVLDCGWKAVKKFDYLHNLRDRLKKSS